MTPKTGREFPLCTGIDSSCIAQGTNAIHNSHRLREMAAGSARGRIRKQARLTDCAASLPMHPHVCTAKGSGGMQHYLESSTMHVLQGMPLPRPFMSVHS